MFFDWIATFSFSAFLVNFLFHIRLSRFNLILFHFCRVLFVYFSDSLLCLPFYFHSEVSFRL